MGVGRVGASPTTTPPTTPSTINRVGSYGELNVMGPGLLLSSTAGPELLTTCQMIARTARMIKAALVTKR
jgi:hypothetical protein